jgi:hypothetical protein
VSAPAQIDHLVVHAATLEQGVAWCERELGITPGPGGEHVLMSTHNRLLAIGDAAYFEIIAVNPAAPAPQRNRWFAMDEPMRLERVQVEPQLVHFVVNLPDIAAGLRACPYDLGDAIAASRGDLRWKISVRADGALHEGGLIPTLIEWDTARPSERMPRSGIELTSLQFEHPQIDRIEAAHRAVGLASSSIALRYIAAPVPRLTARFVRADGKLVSLSS